MNEISRLKKKIFQFIESQDITRKDFCGKVGISYSNMNGKSLQSELGGEQICEILQHYKVLSPDWLLLDRGTMLRDDNEVASSISSPQDNVMSAKDMRDLIMSQQEIILSQQRLIDNLVKKENTTLVSTPTIARSTTRKAG
ncbi:MAG: hypothetical protein ACRCSB_04575 [Bacteroidales bacterium]